MPYDQISHGEVYDSHVYEKKVLKHTYYCDACKRSFVVAKETEKCKFCGSPVKELKDELFNKMIKSLKYHYYCDFCRKDYIVHYKPVRCTCGTPVRRANRLDKPSVLDKLAETVPAVKDLRERRAEVHTRIAEEKANQSIGEAAQEQPESAQPRKKFSFRRPKLRVFTLPRTRLRRKKEELPSD